MPFKSAWFVPVLLMLGMPALAGDRTKPNVLLFYADDLGYAEVGCYGGREVPTPHIDSIATNGIRFTQGYVAAPLCSPSRAGLMTGRYPTRYGHENNGMAEGKTLPLAETTMANRMKALGYATGIVGKWHLGEAVESLPVRRGFDDCYGVTANPGSYFHPRNFLDSRVSSEVQPVRQDGFYTTDAFASFASEWIRRHKDAPWFLYLPFNAVHKPHEASDKYLSRFAHIADPDRRQFDGMLSAMDDAVGAVLGTVRDLGLETNTLVFFISDNGAPQGREGANAPLRGGKHTTWEGGIRVPFLVQWKGTLPAGIAFEKPAAQLDVLPTCVAAAGGVPDPAWKLDGVNLLPYLRGDVKGRPHETLFWRIDGMWAVRHEDWKLVHGSPGAQAPELFDLSKDTAEAHDLAASMPDKAKELRGLWEGWNATQAPPDPKAAAKAGKAARGKRAHRKAR